MGNLLTLKYWFNLNPGLFLPQYTKFIYGIIILILIIGFMAWFFADKNKKDRLIQKFWGKIQGLCLTVGLIAAILVLGRQYKINFLGMPFLLFLLFIGTLVWAYFIFRYITKTVPKRREDQQAKALKEKYL